VTSPPAARRDGQYFDALVREAGDFNPFADRGWRTLARRFEAVVAPGVQLRVIDVGCGTGQSHRVYADRADWYVGLDLSREAVAAARRRNRALSVVQADALRLPIADATADVVAFSSVLHHVDDRRRALAEAHRVLRPGGMIFAFDPNLHHPAMLVFRHPSSPLYRREGVSATERPLAPAALRADFAAAGLDRIGQRCVSDIPYRQVAVRSLDAMLPIYNRVDWLWEKSGLGRWFGSFVVTWGWKRSEKGETL
jgi:SAM-dependent methyltransferase